jgi:D-alanine-D-alanine ligase-like ATP-grasp enzyme
LAGIYAELEKEVRIEVDGRHASCGDKRDMRMVAEAQRVKVTPLYAVTGDRTKLKFTRVG